MVPLSTDHGRGSQEEEDDEDDVRMMRMRMMRGIVGARLLWKLSWKYDRWHHGMWNIGGILTVKDFVTVYIFCDHLCLYYLYLMAILKKDPFRFVHY